MRSIILLSLLLGSCLVLASSESSSESAESEDISVEEGGLVEVSEPSAPVESWEPVEDITEAEPWPSRREHTFGFLFCSFQCHYDCWNTGFWSGYCRYGECVCGRQRSTTTTTTTPRTP